MEKDIASNDPDVARKTRADHVAKDAGGPLFGC